MLQHCFDGGFLQSAYWERFQKALGRKTYKVESDDLSALMIEYKLPVVGGYFFVPRGPIMKFTIYNFQFSNEPSAYFCHSRAIGNPESRGSEENNDFKTVKTGISKMIAIAKENGAGWIRVEPQSEEDLDVIRESLRGKYKLVKSKKNHEPAETLMADLSESEEKILKAMKQKTRYNIRLAEKKGVKVFSSREKKYVDAFWNLTEVTSKRDGIVSHPKKYYETMLGVVPEDALKLYVAEFEGEVIAAALVSFSGGVATYLHGASSNSQRNVMAPYLVQWQAMKDAKELGCTKYDFGGTKIVKSSIRQPAEKVQNYGNSWEGITRFKLGFCSEKGLVEFPGCWDVVIDKKKYWLYRAIQMVKDLMRGR